MSKKPIREPIQCSCQLEITKLSKGINKVRRYFVEFQILFYKLCLTVIRLYNSRFLKYLRYLIILQIGKRKLPKEVQCETENSDGEFYFDSLILTVVLSIATFY